MERRVTAWLQISLAILLLWIGCNRQARAEGSRQLTRLGVETRVLFGLQGFAAFDSRDTNSRLFFRVKTLQERVYLGFGVARNNDEFNGVVRRAYFRIRNARGQVVQPTRRTPETIGQAGFISSTSQSFPDVLGPGGYTSGLVFMPTEVGDYYLELSGDSLLPRGTFNIAHFDVTVVNAVTNAEQTGRLWSRRWSLSVGGFNRPTQAQAYIYSADSVVTRIEFNGMEPFNYFLAANGRGLGLSSNPLVNRQSTSQSRAGINPEYPVFLQNPDSTLWPSGRGPIRLVEAPKLIFCAGRGYFIRLAVNKGQEAEVLLDLNGVPGYQAGTSDRILLVALQTGVNLIPWDGTDGLGAIYIVGSQPIPIEITVLRGQTHLPLVDVENNPRGWIVSLVRPLQGNLRVFWDDTPFPGGTSNLTGCLGACHSFPNGFGDNRAINTWWNAGTYLPLRDTMRADTLCPSISLQAQVIPGTYCSDLGYAIPSVTGYIGPVSFTWLELPSRTPSLPLRDGQFVFPTISRFLLVSRDLMTGFKDSIFVDPAPSPDSLVFQNPLVTAAVSCGGLGQAQASIFGLSSLQYRWRNLATGTILASPDTFATLNALPGRYRLMVKSLEFGCRDSLDFIIPGPTSSVSLGSVSVVPPTTCTGLGQVSATINPSPETPVILWKEVPSGRILPETSPTLQAQPGRYRIIVRAGLPASCPDSLEATIVGPDSIPISWVISPPSTCGGNGTITASIQDPSGTYSVIWKALANQQVINTCCTVVSVLPGRYRIVVTNTTFRCRDSAEIIMPSRPSLRLSTIRTINPNCSSPSGLWEVGVTSASGSPVFIWKRLPSLQVISSITGSVLQAVAGSYRVVVRDPVTGCIDSLDQTLLPQPVIRLSTIRTIDPNCSSPSGLWEVGVTPVSGSPVFVWKRLPSLQVISSITGSVLQAVAGTYRVVVRDPVTGCVDSLDKTITFRPGLGIALSASVDSLNCKLQAIGANNWTDYQIRWYRLPNRQVLTDTQTSVTATPGSYRLVVSKNSGCIDSVTVEQPGLRPSTFAGIPNQICLGSGPYTLVPSLLGGVFSGVGIIGNQFFAADTGWRSITYTRGSGACVQTSQQQVYIVSPPNPQFANPGPLCQGGTPVSLTPQVLGGLFQGPFVTGSQFTPQESGSFTVTYILNTNGCESRATQSVIVSDKPTIDLGPQPLEIPINKPYRFTIQSNGRIKWTPAIGIDADTSRNVQITLSKDQIYQITATNSIGCQQTKTLEVKVIAPMVIPNVITPNGDDKNQAFVIDNLKGDWTLIIYNRWGQAVYESPRYRNDWSGEGLNAGVYFYLLSKPGQEPAKGWVSIER